MKNEFLFPDGERRRDAALPEDPRRALEQARRVARPGAGRCPECGDDLLPVGGCRVCRQCGWEACSW